MNSIPCNLKNHQLYLTVKSHLILHFGREPTVDELKQLINVINTDHYLPINRDVKRSKELLICWLCKNWETVQKYLPLTSFEILKNPNNIIDFSSCSKEKKKKLKVEFLFRDKMIDVENILKNFFNTKKMKMIELRELANCICKKSNLKLNRNEKRDKFANIVWFTKNWEVIKPILDQGVFYISNNELDFKNDLSEIENLSDEDFCQDILINY